MSSTTTTPRRSRVRLGVFGILWILVLLNFVDRSALSISLPFISDDFKLSPAVNGWVLGSFFWTYLLFQIPGGWLLDRIGARKVVLFAAGLWGLFQVLGGIATGGIMLVISRLGMGMSEAPVYPAGSKLNSKWLASRERARGATFIDAASPFGSAVGGLIVTGLIGLSGSWRWSFIITGAITVAVAGLYYLYVRDDPEQHPKVNEAELDHIHGDDVVARETETGPLPGVADYARSSSFWSMWLGLLGWATVWWGIISWSPSYLSTALHFSLAGLGWGTFFIYGMGVLGQVVAGWSTDRLRARTTNYNGAMKLVLAVSGVGTVVSILALPLTHSGYAALVALALAVFFNQFGGVYWAIPSWLSPKPQVGRVGSVMNVASSLGGAIAPVVMGYAIAASGGGYTGAFVFLAVAGIVYLGGSMFIDFNRPLAVRRAA
ncbi:MFS transporter [Curtobacterium sp. MCBD17_013]|uniref:MFS transporter n=1 Tax=Curtobacterium sp. MCBD17_013 TaxID=2175668 RepID=UPI000DA878FA|nr:MFS transporter [Curtobacterium sp. MCBD17_013]PZF59076.1 MFS transporter [Curtobacterium sp. MCBD17_013]